MAHNKQLADERGISLENRQYIDQLHDLLEKLIDSYTLEIPYDEAKELVQSANKTLSDLWGFNYNPYLDKWTPRLTQKWMELTWFGRKFRCKETGTEVTIEMIDIYERNLISVGNAYVDLGTAYYSRFGGNIQEIKG